jgi:hypothetical protein
MGRDLERSLEVIQDEASKAMEAVEALKNLERTDKARKRILYLSLPFIMMCVCIGAVTLWSVTKTYVDKQEEDKEIRAVLANPDMAAMIEYAGNGQCKVTNNLETMDINFMWTSLAPGEETTVDCTYVVGKGWCVGIYVVTRAGMEPEFVIANHLVCVPGDE